MEEMGQSILERNHITADDIDYFIAHQANIRIIDAASEKLGLPREKVVRNIHKFGNTTAATIPLAIGDALDDGRLKKGNLVLFAAVGAGFTAGSMLMRWAY
jgi:3-oxoacyl-[acyl-carrier-protein] synthase-3